MSSPFKYKTYTKLFLAQIISLVGTGVTTIALALLAWELAKEQAGLVLGTALALKMAAYVFFSPIVATFANKISRRKWLLSLDLIRALLVLYFPFITSVYEIYIVLFLINLASAGFTPVFQATIADIVKEKIAYTKALSYSRLAYDLEQLLSPSLAALLLTFMSFNLLFILDSFTFVISSIFILFTTIPFVKEVKSEEKFFEKLKFGVSSYFKTPRLRALFFMYIIVALTSAMMITNTVVFVRDIFEKSDSQTAFAFAVAGFGSMVIALLLPRFLEKIALRTVVLSGSFILVLGLFLGFFSHTWISFLILWFLLGVGLSIVQIPAGFLVKTSCNSKDSVSYFSANFSLSHLCWMIAYPLTGFLGLYFGLDTTFLIIAVISFVAFIFAYKIYPNPDELAIEHTHKKHTHSHEGIDNLHHENEEYTHTHQAITHKHKFVIDNHHTTWPR